MSLSSDLISQFVKITKDQEETSKETTVYGTTVDYNGSTYVKLDGSELLTPVSTTTDTTSGERVTVMIKNHTATVTGNLTSPSAKASTVEDNASKISEFEIIVAHRVVADDVEAVNLRVETLKATVAKITTLSATDVSAVNAEIENIQSKIVNTEYLKSTDIEAINAEIENLRSKFGTFQGISTSDLDAVNADIDFLKSYSADFTYVSTDVLTAMKANIKELDAKKLTAEQADLKYANIDFANIGEAAIKEFYAKSGTIRDVVISDGQVTGKLVGVTIKGDLIEGGTVVADKLVIQGEDGLYYKLNTTGETVSAQQTEYNSLNGTIITAQSITAEKIAVDDLVAFDATIGGFNITKDSLYSGAKASVDNTTRGIYLDDEGQLSIGDTSNFIRYYKDANGAYKLELSANSISLRSTDMSVNFEDAIIDVSNSLENIDAKATAAGKTASNAQDQANKASEAASSAQEQAADIYSVMETNYSSITEDIHGITTEVGTIKTTVTEFEDQLETKASVEDVKTMIEQSASDLTISITESLNKSDATDAELDSLLTTLKKYFTFDASGLTIGDGSSAITLTLDNGVIKFQNGGSTFAYWSGTDNMFYTGDIMVEVNHKAQFGNFAFLPRDDGSLSFMKVTS